MNPLARRAFLSIPILCLYFVPASALDWQVAPGCRWAALPVPKDGKTGFTLLAPEATGIRFTNVLSDAKAAENQIRLNGSGVALGDVDGDGLCDIYFCRLEGPNVLYRNLGNWKFEDITEQAGVACPGQYSTGAVFADVNGDGFLDLLVNALGGGTRLFLNDGKGHFTEAKDSGLSQQFASTSMALADIDGNGTLDLYVANYRRTTVRSTGLEMLNINGKRMLKPEDRETMYITPEGFLREYGEVDFVYLNDGKGHFTPLSWTDGTFRDEAGAPLAAPPRDWGLSVAFRDLNGDGAPDIYVCNDFWSPDRIWLNDGHGHFRALPRPAMPNTSSLSMGVDFADINRDGFDDFIVLDMLSPDHARRITQSSRAGAAAAPIGYSAERPQVDRNTLFLNRGDGSYTEIAQLAGLDATEWSWCPIFLDVDLDGYEDLLVGAGAGFDTQDADAEVRIRAQGRRPREKVGLNLLMYPRLPLPNQAFRNRRDLTFEEVGAQWGFNTTNMAQGMALADLDNDGSLDVVVNNLNGPAGIYRNNTGAPRVVVRLKGRSPNTRGIGAKIKVFRGAVPLQSQEMMAGGRYLSGDDAVRVFAAGTLTNEMRIQVEWRSGARSVILGVRANRVYEIDEAAAANGPSPSPVTDATKPSPLFQDVSDRLKHIHHQEPFDDLARQPLLPKRLSQLGPGVSWFDADGDGREDLIISGGKGGRLTVFHNDGQGGFESMTNSPLDQPLTNNLTSVLGWRKSAQKRFLLAGNSNYEDGSTNTSSVRRYDLTANTVDEIVPGADASSGPLALADIDGNGELALFVGGRVIPGHYPSAASSRLFRSSGGKLVLDEPNTKALEAVGLVSGAVFSDLDGDGFPELILACEWGPIRVFHNDHGRFTEATKEWGLDGFVGWWNGVCVGDFNNDGKMDIVASNWGRNTKYERHRAKPLSLYYGDLNGSGTTDLVEAYFDQSMQKIVPWRDFDSMADASPFTRGKFATYRAYGEASVEEIFGERLKQARELQANTLDSMVFLNQGNRFVAKSLPLEAQIAPAFAVCVGDLDGDGKEDVFLSQNFFATEPQTTPYDAGRGLLLRGDGGGGFATVSAVESGIAVYGEQRGAALADYDADGRVDLVVTQNGGPTKLFHNAGARAGLRVRLNGPPGNPDGIGATLRLIFGTRAGPASEIHAGSGYWSQDSAVQVMATPERPSQIWLRWPGGTTVTSAIPPEAHEISVDQSGKVMLLK